MGANKFSKMVGPLESEQLQALRQLDGVLEELDRLVLNCAANSRLTEGDEDHFSKLLGDGQRLHGRLSSMLGMVVMEWQGRRWDAFQRVLGTPSISSLLSPYSTVDIWLESFKPAQSIVKQTIGKLEEVERRGQLEFSPEVVARYRMPIIWAEAIRRALRVCIKWVCDRLGFLDPLARRLEHWWPVRLVLLFGGLAGGIAVIVAGWQFLL